MQRWGFGRTVALMEKSPHTDTACRSCAAGRTLRLALTVPAERGQRVVGKKGGAHSGGLLVGIGGRKQVEELPHSLKARVFSHTQPNVDQRTERHARLMG
jgi:hypothetical protein